MLSLYEIAKNSIVGDVVICPSCETPFKKTNYQSVFCKSKGKRVCNDRFWNTIDKNKRDKRRYDKYNVGDKSFIARLGDSYAKSKGYPSYEEMIDNQAMDDPSWSSHGGIEISICRICDLRADYCRCGEY